MKKTQTQQQPEKKLPLTRNLDAIAKVHITDNFIKQLYITHSHVPKGIEWCGFLVYKVIKGSLSDYNNFEFEILGFLPVDIGTSGYTDAKVSDHIIDVSEEFPELLESGLGDNPIIKTGFIHTHHNMETFFSPTDKDELLSNSLFHNYYLSVIVNYKGDIIGKVGIPVKTKTNSIIYKEEIIKNDEGEDIIIKNTINSDEEEDLILIIDCEFTYTNLGNIFENKLNSLVDKYDKEQKRKAELSKLNHNKWDNNKWDNNKRDNYSQGKLWDKNNLKDFTKPKDVRISDTVLDMIVGKIIYNDLTLTTKYSDTREEFKNETENQSFAETVFCIELLEETFTENIRTLFKAGNSNPNYIKRVYLLLEYYREYLKELGPTLEIENTFLDLLEDEYWELTENPDRELVQLVKL